jgi:hypothetical protein
MSDEISVRYYAAIIIYGNFEIYFKDFRNILFSKCEISYSTPAIYLELLTAELCIQGYISKKKSASCKANRAFLESCGLFFRYIAKVVKSESQWAGYENIATPRLNYFPCLRPEI